MIHHRSKLQSALWGVAAKYNVHIDGGYLGELEDWLGRQLPPGAKDSGGKHRHKSGNKDGNKYLRMAFG